LISSNLGFLTIFFYFEGLTFHKAEVLNGNSMASRQEVYRERPQSLTEARARILEGETIFGDPIRDFVILNIDTPARAIKLRNLLSTRERKINSAVGGEILVISRRIVQTWIENELIEKEFLGLRLGKIEGEGISLKIFNDGGSGLYVPMEGYAAAGHFLFDPRETSPSFNRKDLCISGLPNAVLVGEGEIEIWRSRSPVNEQNYKKLAEVLGKGRNGSS